MTQPTIPQMPQVINCGNQLKTIDDAYQVTQNLKQYIQIQQLVTLDFSDILYVKPMGDSLFARELREFVKTRIDFGFPTNAILPRIKNVKGYLDYTGFFDFIGLKGNFNKVRPQITEKPTTYLPITKYDFSDFHVLPEEDEIKPFSLIETQAELISRLFTKDSRPNVSMTYIIREILRNCFEHSNSASYHVWAQYWDTDDSLELVILDDGIGILENLKVKYPNLKNDSEAISKALEPGVSRANFNTASNKYDNSGFGLYVISELAKRHGSFFIGSKTAGLHISSDDKKTYSISNGGTLISIRINKISNRDYENEIKEIIEAGEKISTQSEYPTKASKQTLLF